MMWSLLLPLNSLGLALWCLASGACLLRPLDGTCPLKTLYLQLYVGLSALYLCVLAGVPLGILHRAIAILLPVALWFRGRELWAGLRHGGRPLLHLAVLALPFLFFLFFEPIRNGDALAIWFLHGKMLYLGQHLGNAIGFERGLDLGYDAHMDYPKLIAALSALVATANGFWNEYLPKSALAVLLLLPVVGLAAVTVLSTTAKVLFFTAWFLLSLHKGAGQFMDYWLAMFTLLAVLYLVEYKRHARQTDLLCFLASCCLLPSLKNEGSTLAAILLCLAVALGPARPLLRFRTWISGGSPLLILLPVCSGILWAVRKHLMGIHVDLDFLSSTAVNRIVSRMDMEHIQLFLFHIFYKGHLLFAMAAGVAAVFFSKRRPEATGHPTQAVPFCMTYVFSFCLLYFSILTWIYFTTYHDFGWHLDTSADRVVLPMLLVSFVPLALLWTHREDPGQQ